MDCVIYLQQDLAYRADRVDGFLTLLWHPDQDALIGVKIKGFRWIFKRLQAFCDGKNVPMPDAAFVPLMKAIEMALTAGLAAIVSRAAEADEPPPPEEVEAEQRTIEEGYQKAREIVGSMTVDASELLQAA
jgi:hypothetical protein